MSSSSRPPAAKDRGSTRRLLVVALLAALSCAALALAGSAEAQQLDNLDPSFGSGGLVLSDVASGASALALQPDGKSVLAGSDFDSQGLQQVVVTRFDSDGKPDSGFGTGGKVALQLGLGTTPSSGATAVALQTDGKIVLAGTASDSSGNQGIMVARLNADGTPDDTFDGDGKLVLQLGAAGRTSGLNAVALQSDGKIVVTGQSSDSDGSTRLLVARLTTSGAFDSSFDGDGRVITQIGKASGTAEQGSAIALQPDGKIVVGGSAADKSGSVAFLVARLDTSGAFDGSFGAGGVALSQLGLGSPRLSRVSALALQPDGKVLAAGDATPASGNSGLMVARLDTDGGFDASFGAGGIVATQLGDGFNAFSAVASLALQPDGNVVAGGVTTDSNGDSSVLVARLRGADGTFDSSFGEAGRLVAQVGAGAIPFSQVAAIALQGDGKIVLGGVANVAGGDTNLLLARIFHDAAPTPAFSMTSPAVEGAPVAFDASASTDPDGTIGSYSWDFGDGGRATGATASHTYATAGDYTVRLTVTDDRGLPATLSRTVSVAPGNQLTPSLTATISSLGMSPHQFAAATSGGSISRHTGATVNYRDSRASTTTFQVRQAVRGTFSKGHCMKPARGLHGRRCARYVKVGEFTHADQAGLNSFHFTGRLNRKKLVPGRYRLRAVPSLGGRVGIAAGTDFVILP